MSPECVDLYFERLTLWPDRLNKFVHDIVFQHQPAIIIVQEAYLDSEGWCNLHGEEIDKGDYLGYLVWRINARLGRDELGCGKYHIATTVKTGHGITEDCEEWHGTAIIYDSQQVRHVYPRPRPGETEYYGCLEWNEGQTEHYEVSMEYGIHNDCLPKQGGDHARVSRAVFEFPLHSNRYLSLYNTHQEIPPCDIPDSILYIRDRQETFRDDLEGYLLDDRRARKPFWIYPPIFAGDMNTRGPGYTNTDEWMDECNITDEGERQEIEALLSSFVDAPGAGPIDKVWVGDPLGWTHDVRLEIIKPPDIGDLECRMTVYPPFSCATWGYYMTGTDSAYTDHSPSMVEVEAIHD